MKQEFAEKGVQVGGSSDLDETLYVDVDDNQEEDLPSSDVIDKAIASAEAEGERGGWVAADRRNRIHNLLSTAMILFGETKEARFYHFGDQNQCSLKYYKKEDKVAMRVESKKKLMKIEFSKTILKEIECSLFHVRDAMEMWDNAKPKADLLFHPVGDKVHLSINKISTLFVNIRYWYLKENADVSPYTSTFVGKKHLYAVLQGVPLTGSQWEQFKAVLAALNLQEAEFESLSPCMLRDDHANQMGYLQCSTCNPYFHEYFSD